MATVLMAAYTNYRRDPRVRREAEVLVQAGHRVVFIASRQRGEPNREILAGVEVVKKFGLRNRRSSKVVYVADYVLFFAMLMFSSSCSTVLQPMITVSTGSVSV